MHHSAPADRWLRTPSVARVGGHPASALCEPRVTHGVHPAVKEVEPAGLNSPFDRGGLHAGSEQLRAAHNSVLAPGERGEHRIRAKVACFGADSAPY